MARRGGVAGTIPIERCATPRCVAIGATHAMPTTRAFWESGRRWRRMRGVCRANCLMGISPQALPPQAPIGAFDLGARAIQWVQLSRHAQEPRCPPPRGFGGASGSASGSGLALLHEGR